MGEGRALSGLYEVILRDYLSEGSEADLYSALNLGKICVEEEIGPDELVGLHLAALKRFMKEDKAELTVEKLLQSLNLLVEVMVAYGLCYRNYIESKIRNRQLEQELEIAKKIQTSLLPTRLPKLPNIEIGVRMIPAREVGGDYYNTMELENNEIGIWVGDVSGKGIPAALLISMLNYAIKGFSFNSAIREPNKTLQKLNELICDNIDTESFISLFYARLNRDANTLIYANGGHEPPLLFRQSTRQYFLLEGDGLVLGVEKGIEFEETEVKLHPGDVLVFYTDGVTEARNEHQETFGFARLKALVGKNSTLTAQSLADRLINFVLNHSQMKFTDDLTLMVIKVL